MERTAKHTNTSRVAALALLTLSLACGHAEDVLATAPTPSYAWFRIYADSSLEHEEYDRIGGTVYPVLYLNLGAAERVAEGAAPVAVQVQDLHRVHVVDGVRDPRTLADLEEVDLFATSGWERKSGDGWLACGGPGTYDNSQATTPVVFRRRLGATGWNTQTMPLGHNDEHQLLAAAPISFQSNVDGQWATPYTAGPRPRRCAIGNLTIRDVATNFSADYLIYDPDSSDATFREPRISFTVDDATPHQYRWVVYLRPTAAGSWTSDRCAYVTGTCLQPSRIEAVWHGRPDNNSGPLLDWPEPYTFDVFVYEVADASTFNFEPELTIELVGYKAPYLLTVPETVLADDGSVRPGHEFEIDPARLASTGPDLPTVISYQLEDAICQPAARTELHLRDTALTLRDQRAGPVEAGVYHADRPLAPIGGEDLFVTGIWRGLVSGSDGHASEYRDHLARRLITVNEPDPKVDLPREIQIQASEIVARERMKKDGWQIIIDPGKRHPFGAGGGPDVFCYKTENGRLIVAFVDNKMYNSDVIGAGDLTRLVDLDHWKQYVRNYLAAHEDRIGSQLVKELRDALADDARIRRYVTNAGGVTTRLTDSAIAHGIELLSDTREWALEHKAAKWVAALEGSKRYFGILADTGRWSAFCTQARGLLRRAGKALTVVSVVCVALDICHVGLEQAAVNLGRDLVCAELVEAVAGWVDERVKRALGRLASIVYNTRYMRAIEEAMEEDE